MKCKVCGGTGTSNTCVNGTFKPCSFCDGTGEYEPFDADVELDKLYPPEQTNEKWFCGLSTEEKAKWLADNFGFVAYKASGGNPKRVKEDLVEYWQEWLKQPLDLRGSYEVLTRLMRGDYIL